MLATIVVLGTSVYLFTMYVVCCTGTNNKERR